MRSKFLIEGREDCFNGSILDNLDTIECQQDLELLELIQVGDQKWVWVPLENPVPTICIKHDFFQVLSEKVSQHDLDIRPRVSELLSDPLVLHCEHRSPHTTIDKG